MQKAQGGLNLHDFDLAVRALRVLNAYPHAQIEGKNTVKIGDTKQIFKVAFVDTLGSPFKGISKTVKAHLVSPKN